MIDRRRLPAAIRRSLRCAALCAASALAALLLSAAGVAAEPPRIVSIGGSVTEVVDALGATSQLVAVDSTSRHPAAVRALPDVGYMRALSAEPILALAPTLVLAVADAGPPNVLALLREAGIRVVSVPDAPDVGGIVDKIGTVATALGLQRRGEALAGRLRREMDTVARQVASVRHRPRVLFLLSVGRGSPLAGGRGTAADAMIRLAGGVNAIEGLTHYKPVATEALVAAAPDVVLVTRRTLAQLGGEAALLSMPGLDVTPAARARRVVAMDGLLLLGFGPRTPAAIRELAGALHPGFGD